MFSIYKRELKSFFCGYRGYAFTALFVLLTFAIRMVYNYMALYDSIYGFINHESVLAFLPAAFAIAAPILTFSIYENERKKDVFAFLRSLPLKATDIIFGKYLAALTVFACVYAVTLAVDLILGFYSGSAVLSVLLSIFGFILICNAILALDTFLAAVCKNKYLALGLSYGISAALVVLTVFRYSLPKILNDVITPFAVFGGYTSFVFGLLDLSPLVIWISVGGLFVYLTYLVMKKEIRL